MDDARFDRLTRLIEERLTRRGAAFGIAALTATGLAAEDAAAKKKRGKKKKGGKKKNRACRLGKVDDACQRDGDCCGGFNCSQRIPDTCQVCSHAGGGCSSVAACCSPTADCRAQDWAGGDQVCCEPLDGSCFYDDECCEGFVCNEDTGRCVTP